MGGTWKVLGRSPSTGDKERWNREMRYSIIYRLLKKKRKIGLVEEVLGVFVCLCPYLILLIITFETRFPVVIQTSLCGET